MIDRIWFILNLIIFIILMILLLGCSSAYTGKGSLYGRCGYTVQDSLGRPRGYVYTPCVTEYETTVQTINGVDHVTVQEHRYDTVREWEEVQKEQELIEWERRNAEKNLKNAE